MFTRSTMPKEAVVIIDVQNGILADPNLVRPDATRAALDAVVARIATLLTQARARDVPVLFVQHDGPTGHRLQKGSPGWLIRPEIAPAPGEPIIHKTACDSFFETTLAAELEARQIRQLIVAGCMTQYCVDTSVRRAVSLGYDVTLVADGHMTADTGPLTFEQIIAHHNFVLDGFDAGSHSVRVVPLDQISW
jgi:nicotinamidase-related amidase